MKQTRFALISILILLTLTLAACAAPPTRPDDTTPVQPAEAVSPAEEKMPEATISPEMQPMADKATGILAEALTVSPENVTILEVQRVEWRDASLGCPKPGMMYAQVITPGYLIKAQVNGETQMLHMNEAGRGVVCPPDRAKQPYSATK